MKPGSMSSSERTAPPGVGAASSTSTSQPRSTSRFAATNPFGPAPITTASGIIPKYRERVAKKRSLDEYDAKRDFARTPEPKGKRPKGTHESRFVVQEHHARALHWDLRLERDGVLASWAVPKGIPPDPKKNHLAVRTEDHPLEYLDFQGDIPKGEYGGGSMHVWDRGTFETHKFDDREVMVTLHGERVQGRYVLFKTHGNQWMIHRMDPP